MKILAENKRVYHDYQILDKLEAGIMLQGWEVKAVKEKHFHIGGSFVVQKGNTVILTGSKIVPLQYSPEVSKTLQDRERTLLLHKNQILKLGLENKKVGATIVPLQVYLGDNNLIKIEIAMVKGKKKYDKRETIKKRDIERKIRQERLS